MKPVIFFDTETDQQGRKVLNIGGIDQQGAVFHSASLRKFADFLQHAEYLCGHNILKHDYPLIRPALDDNGNSRLKLLDTLYLSPLLFPKKPYHKLLKDDKLQRDELNNPVNDSQKARDLFYDEVDAFEKLEEPMQQVYYHLLYDQPEFGAFFDYLSFQPDSYTSLKELITQTFYGLICEEAPLNMLIQEHPVSLAYGLALIRCNDRYSITPPWVLNNFPGVTRILYLLRNKPCLQGCSYCNEALDARKGLQRHFGFNSFRTWAGEPLQERAVQAAVDDGSLLAVFPTGGGKSITFQVPALMAGENVKGLTVVISPLQSLMKDQVDNLEKNGITTAVTINGLLDPVERSKSFERVEDGSASLLYISPESLRSRTIERLLLGRNVVRFVIDEAHCFSSWGQDFRVDYLYIGDFIRKLQEKKNLGYPLPVSCFTATAKQNVIQDICDYFQEKLSLDLQVFRTGVARTNLQYEVINCGDEGEKYKVMRGLIEKHHCPSIIYVSRTRRAYNLAEQLCKDGFNARPYHGRMDTREKTENQNAFLSGEVQIMVATSAFGMGVDKKDVGLVVHFDISDSLENYVQEAGRAGRDEQISARCYVLFNEDDLSKHFTLLNQTRLSVKEIQQIWRAVKEITRTRSAMSSSTLEIARKAGWDDTVADIETRVTTAIAALENAGYLKRGQNIPRIYASSILYKTAQEAIEKIHASERFNDKQKEQAIRIIRKLIAAKSRKEASDEVAESRIDYISDHLGIVKEDVINIINLLREEKILADTKDLTVLIKKDLDANKSKTIALAYAGIENFLVQWLKEGEQTYHLKELNEGAMAEGCEPVSLNMIRTVLNYWSVKNMIKFGKKHASKNHVSVINYNTKAELKEWLEKRHVLAGFIVDYLFSKVLGDDDVDVRNKEEVLVEFSVHELREAYLKSGMLFTLAVTIADIEDALFFLSKIDALRIEGGFMVVYNRLSIDRLEMNNKVQYKNDDYKQLGDFYQNKVQQIHIVGEYARKMLEDYNRALHFVDDYFRLNYTSFLNKYFPGSRKDEIRRNITPGRFRQLFGTLSIPQLNIIREQEAKYIVVAAGPGSGKTRVLVHKLASLLLMEEVKHEQLLMLTFSRAAATEFKKRLIDLIGNAANFVEIKTFHSYCFDLLGRMGSIEESGKILPVATEKIGNNDIERNRITKTVLVIDEAQDMDEHEFNLVKMLMEKNEEMRVVAVGDDDQNIYSFRGADSKYFEAITRLPEARKYELVDNYRSCANLVVFANQFAEKISHRFKEIPVNPFRKETGQIGLVKYRGSQLIVPLVKELIQADLSGSTGVLTATNEEAVKVFGLLQHQKIPAKLIQGDEVFNLFNLFEIRAFCNMVNSGKQSPLIGKDTWNDAKRWFHRTFQRSIHYELSKTLLKDFQDTHPKVKYKSDLEMFIRESRLEDFAFRNKEKISVSTIHKAKGREFDNVYLLLNHFDVGSDENKRALYVAMTRAKENLYIHLNGGYLDGSIADNMQQREDKATYHEPERLVLYLGHKDVNLGYFRYVQHRISELSSGGKLRIDGDELLNESGDTVVKFSKNFQERIKKMEEMDYVLCSAMVNYLVYWKQQDGNEEEQEEILIALPAVKMKRR